MSERKTVVIAGAGPAGLTAAYQLLNETDCQPFVIEKENQVGGISRTVSHHGNRMDIGGHRFFSKSDWVMSWWAQHLRCDFDTNQQINYHNRRRTVVNGNGDGGRMLLRPRLSRIYFLRRFFDYPVRLNLNTVRNLGLWRMLKIGVSYAHARVFPIKPERHLEDFFINRFGRELYRTFFKDYTEKVWGTSCTDISPEWGAQRIKGLSIAAALKHMAKSSWVRLTGRSQTADNTSLIEQFLYPEFGPGQMWETVARKIENLGGIVQLNTIVTDLEVDYEARRIRRVKLLDQTNNVSTWVDCDYFISSMPVRELTTHFAQVPAEVRAVSEGLQYRDFITVGLLLKKLKPSHATRGSNNLLPDNWIYIQEPDVKLGRLQIFNNWSPSLVNDSNTVWLGLEYFCNEGDSLWQLSDDAVKAFAVDELEKLELIDANDVLDYKVLRVEKAYPAYFGSYGRFDVLRRYFDEFDNLFLVGRNGMHRYNNQDHSMLTAKIAVESIRDRQDYREAIWNTNVDDDYHEEKSSSISDTNSAYVKAGVGADT